MDGEFRVEVRRSDGATVVAVSGELDLATSGELETTLTEVEADAPALLALDLGAVEFMDSSGLAVVVKAHQRAQEAGRRFGVIDGSPQVQRLLALTGMDARMTVVHSLGELLSGD